MLRRLAFREARSAGSYREVGSLFDGACWATEDVSGWVMWIKVLQVDRCGAPEVARKLACEQRRTPCGVKPVHNAFAKAGNS